MNLQQNRIRIREQLKVFRRIVYVILVLVIIMFSFMLFGYMDDEVMGNGTVTGIRDYDLKALVSARTVRIIRHEGEFVERGEKLLEFDDRNQRDRITVLKNQLKELELTIAVKEKDFKLLQKDPLPAYYRHTRLQLKEARERLTRSQHEVEVYKKLYGQKVISRREFLKIEMEHLGNTMTVQRLEEDWQKLQDGMAAEILDKAKQELDLLRQKRAGKLDELAMAERHLEDYVMRAPDAGILADIPPRPGGYYEKGDVIIKFAANQNKKVIALINEKQIFKVEPGQPARITSKQYNYLDYGYFHGKVDLIYQLPVEINGQNYYPVKIILTGEPQPLRFGSGCEITIITGRERIIFALLGIRSKDYLQRHGLDFRKKFQRILPASPNRESAGKDTGTSAAHPAEKLPSATAADGKKSEPDKKAAPALRMDDKKTLPIPIEKKSVPDRKEENPVYRISEKKSLPVRDKKEPDSGKNTNDPASASPAKPDSK